ncbi:CBS domain-containing protein [Pseudonocardia yuanmonensis]|uniref:CBS domain-containing protein n=1 Tax=Pseudonocardia yuanmonensis TaxID=1095914 RepID=A0ABP8W0R3_9PSEU
MTAPPLRRTLVRDVMSTRVVSVGPDTEFDEVARLLALHAVRAVPVLEGTRLLGVVSEADLLRTAEFGDPAVPERLRWRESGRPTSARTLMSTAVVTVRPEASVAEAARRMRERGVGWLAVTEFHGTAEHVVGVVGRTDILGMFLRDDAELRAEIVDGVLRPLLGAAADAVTVEVERGVVTLRGAVPRHGHTSRVAALVGRLEGVVAVHAEPASEEATDPAEGPRGVGPPAAGTGPGVPAAPAPRGEG